MIRSGRRYTVRVPQHNRIGERIRNAREKLGIPGSVAGGSRSSPTASCASRVRQGPRGKRVCLVEGDKVGSES